MNFDTRNLVAQWTDLLELVLDGGEPSMPPDDGPAPMPKDIETFLLWLDCGAPD